MTVIVKQEDDGEELCGDEPEPVSDMTTRSMLPNTDSRLHSNEDDEDLDVNVGSESMPVIPETPLPTVIDIDSESNEIVETVETAAVASHCSMEEDCSSASKNFTLSVQDSTITEAAVALAH